MSCYLINYIKANKYFQEIGNIERKFGGNRDYGFKINGYYVFCYKIPTVRREQKRCYEKQSRITIDTMRSETALKSSYIENNTVKKLNLKIKLKN